MKTRTIRQTVTLAASAQDVYESLMDSKKHSEFTGCPAKISGKAGGSFRAMESLRGNNIELVPAEKIVQTWQCDYDGWPRTHFSTLTIRLKPAATGTRLEFAQKGVPAHCSKAIGNAWRKFYWQPLKKMLRRRRETNRH
jgi:activator of HSP90 ATPase